MRIISGQFRSRALQTPAGGQETRPTADRVREALFSMLHMRVEDALVLDLFAGSGALSFEALSRGARHAVMVERAAAAQAAIAANIAALGVMDRAQLLLMEAMPAMEHLQREGRAFDLVFLDPPYAAGLYGQTRSALCTAGLLLPGAWVICESDAALSLPEHDGFVLVREKRYGSTYITIYRWEAT